MESITIEHLTFSYPGRNKPALSEINLHLEAGSFAVLCGGSGSGKSTLLRHLKPVLSPQGTRSGRVLLGETPLARLDFRSVSSQIGFVQQNNENQIVTDKVWHELAFGLESLGLDTPTIRLRVAEMASFFGIQTWFHRDVTDLSGGEKQMLNLAAIMTLQPVVLLLDEPTSQLDPVAAARFLAVVARINRELGTTILLTEHRLEEALPLASRMILMDSGKIVLDGPPADCGMQLSRRQESIYRTMPAPVQVYAAAGMPAAAGTDGCPLTVREGRIWLERRLAKASDGPAEAGRFQESSRPATVISAEPLAGVTEEPPVLTVRGVRFRYEKDLPDVVRDLSLDVRAGEFLAILGANGAGKSTALSLISGVHRPVQGAVTIDGRSIDEIPDQEKFDGLLGMLPQNPQLLFVRQTVEKDLTEMFRGRKIPAAEREARIREAVTLCRLEGLLDRHPYDLSGGEQQRAALAKVLLLKPRILLLDEPTKGMDADFKTAFGGIIRTLCGRGTAVVMVSHDIEFCAEYAGRCLLFFEGAVVSEDAPAAFFSHNVFYTTAAGRMARRILPQAVTTADILTALKVRKDPALAGQGRDEAGHWEAKKPETEKCAAAPAADGRKQPAPAENPAAGDSPRSAEKRRNLPADSVKTPGRIVAALAAAAVFAGTLFYHAEALKFLAFSESQADLHLLDPGSVWPYVRILLVLIVSLLIFFTAAFGKRKRSQPASPQVPKGRRKLSKRTVAAAVLILLFIPLTIFVGVYYLGDRKYFFISMMIIFECMLPFVLIFEGRKPQARELIVIAVLCAIGVAGRAAFFMIPQFKPVAALVIIAAVAFGGEVGFLVGAMTALVSNFFFGQGPWTPWQMFAFGIIGFLAGVLFQKGWLLRGRLSMAIYGGVATLVVYGGLLNSAAVLMYQANPTWPMFVLSLVRGLPFDLIHATATIFFLWVFSQPMLEKLERIQIKYGLLEERKHAGEML